MVLKLTFLLLGTYNLALFCMEFAPEVKLDTIKCLKYLICIGS